MNGIENVFDLGCGPGHFAEVVNNTEKLFLTSNVKQFYGYDFSPSAINMIKNKNFSEKYMFEERDLRDYNFLEHYSKDKKEKTIFTIFEFLEHVWWDLNLLKRIPSGAMVALSVPNVGGPQHVRHFLTTDEIRVRYGDYIIFDSLSKVTAHHFLGIGIKK
jgi:trans-aconitate methyltransferase